MTYQNFRIIFAEIELNYPFKIIAEHFDVSARTLSRWKEKGFKKVRASKFYYCKFCEDWTEAEHKHKRKPRSFHMSITEHKKLTIEKYNKILQKDFETLDKINAFSI